MTNREDNTPELTTPAREPLALLRERIADTAFDMVAAEDRLVELLASFVEIRRSLLRAAGESEVAQ